MEKPLISIIIPVYNVEKYIERCLISILHQTYNKIEVIVVNDGSIDNSGTICQKIADSDNRITYVEKQNEGSGYARNTGMDMAKGNYLMFVDSDDYLMENCIERMVNVALKENADIVKCKWRQGNEDEYKILPKEKKYKIYNHIEAFQTREVNIAVHGKLYKKSVIGDIRYPKVTTHDDEFFTYKLIYAAEKIVVLDEIYYYYYMSDGSIMRQRRNRMPLEYIDAYKQRIQYFTDRSEGELVGISQKEFAIRLMISYFGYDKYEEVGKTKKELGQLFRENYGEGKHYTHSPKEKLSLWVCSMLLKDK